jgi:hypothetical protein
LEVKLAQKSVIISKRKQELNHFLKPGLAMFFKSIFSALIVFVATACIIMAPNRGSDDMYSGSDLSSEKYAITFIETTAEEIINKGEASVYLFACWCPYCLAHLRQQDKNGSREAVYVSSNYDCKSMDRLFRNNTDTIYILSNKHYGSDESKKIKQFASEILGEESDLTGVPQLFFKDNNKYIRAELKN